MKIIPNFISALLIERQIFSWLHDPVRVLVLVQFDLAKSYKGPTAYLPSSPSLGTRATVRQQEWPQPMTWTPDSPAWETSNAQSRERLESLVGKGNGLELGSYQFASTTIRLSAYPRPPYFHPLPQAPVVRGRDT